MCRLLLDTNILIDASLPGRIEHTEAAELVDRCSGWAEFGMMCALSLKDVYYIVSKEHGEPVAREAVRGLTGMLRIAPVDFEVCLNALDSNEPDFEDGIVRACAEINDADYIITRDKDAFSRSKVKSLSATEYLALTTS